MGNRIPRRALGNWNVAKYLKERRLENAARVKEGKGRVVPEGINACFKPSSPQAKADMQELHRDNMRERAARYRTDKRGPDGLKSRGIARFAKWFDKDWKQQDLSWRTKSIWPDGKVAQPGRMMNG